MNTVSMTINNIRVQAQAGESILEAALNAGIDIPHACFLPGADPPVGGCKLCCVELNGEIVYACRVLVSEDMVIRTKTVELENLRRRRLQFPG